MASDTQNNLGKHVELIGYYPTEISGQKGVFQLADRFQILPAADDLHIQARNRQLRIGMVSARNEG